MKDLKALFGNKKILILGLGLNQGGVGAAKFFVQNGARVKVTDLKDKLVLQPSIDKLKDFPNIEYVLGQHRYEDLDWADLIIRNPALKPDNPYLKYAKEKGKQVETDMGIFLQFIKQQQIIGVTGTKGKSTTASLIYEVLKDSGKNVILAGNIGSSVLELIITMQKSILTPLGWQAKLKETLIILELSSFQLSAFGEHKVSPKWAVITNIFPDHLNYYSSIEAYIQDKRYIAQFQKENDFLFLKKGDEITSDPQFLQDLKGQINYFSASNLPKNFHPKLLGEHNLENMAAALAVSKTLFGSGTQVDVLRALENFARVEFRLQLIYDKNDIKIYNDSTSTMPESTRQAVTSLPNSILICGGMNKNLDYTDFAKAIDQNVKSVYFLEGDATDLIKKYLSEIASSQTPRNDVIASEARQSSQDKIKGTYSDLEKLLTDVKAVTKPGDIILFSPGATSFNLFQNEFDRARQFNAAVEKVFG